MDFDMSSVLVGPGLFNHKKREKKRFSTTQIY